ncbi:MAG: 4-(cytidine 5'-diphospho)-2-C-methyl-D-erythritol kinase [Gammaproteobacteria bacterium]|nr:4-(cytidine 5'-diphospho)-2-C-methyl-D-erythritol kinase [Gammaproteobacteria bacterium]
MPDNSRQYWPAPAKINLFLHITGQRPDGYHLLQTVFQFLDIHDQIGFEINTTGEIGSRHQYPGFNQEEDLTIRAARLLQAVSGCQQGADIELIKNLPIGGGIGGGSSDAATVLLVLNKLWKTGLTEDELAHLGLELGADVPVFVHGHACWAEGVGEEFQAIDLPEPVYLLVYPKVHVSTGQIFGARELTRNTSPIRIADFLAGHAGNDCEAMVRQQVPEVDRAMRWLEQYAPARLTGTGSCIFAAFESHEVAEQAADNMDDDWQSWVTQGHNRSLLHQMLDEVFG